MTIKEFKKYLKDFKDIDNRKLTIQIGNNFPEELKIVQFKREDDGTFKIHINPRSLLDPDHQ